MLAHNGNGVGFEWLELEAHMNHLVFISHSSKDTEFAEKLRSKLSERGIKSWLDRDALDNDIEQSCNYPEAIARAIDNSTVFVVVLSISAVESSFVRKELSFAVNRRLRVQPIRIDKLDNTYDSGNVKTFGLLLSDVNVIDASTPPIDDKVNNFVSLVSGAIEDVIDEGTTPLAKQTKLKLLDVDAPDKDVDDANSFIGGAKSKELASFFREAKQLVLKEYAETGDPFETYRYFNEYQIDGHHPKVVARIAAKTNRISVALGWLYESVAYFLINDGEIGYVHDARNYLIEALDVYERIPENPDLPEFTASVRKRVIQSKWLLAITYKQERNLARAHEILSDLIPYAEETRREYEVPYPDSELLPRRELAIVDDDLDEFDKLIEDEPLYSDNAREHFFTLRRCFEAYCFNYEVQRAEAIKPRLENSYKLVKEQLEPVYYYALKFDEFFYYWASGQTDRAERLYQEIYPEMSERHFTRYANTLQKAHADMLRGRHIRSDAYER